MSSAEQGGEVFNPVENVELIHATKACHDYFTATNGAIRYGLEPLKRFLFGHFVLRLDVADNVGATCGSMTGGAAIGEVCKDANSSVPAVSFALGATLQNVTFTIVALVLMNIL